MGITVQHLRSLQRRGILRGLRDKQGWWRFEQTDCELAALELRQERRRSHHGGEIAAVVFADLDAGMTFRELVRKHRQPPRMIRAIMVEWADDGDVVIPAREAREVERLLASRYRQGVPWDELGRVVAALCDAQDDAIGAAFR